MPKLNRYTTEKAVKEIEKLLNSQLNGWGKMQKYNPNGSSNPFWRDMNKRAYYMEHVHLKPEHLKYVLEEKKLLVKWILENYPQYNVPYDPTTLIKRGGRINVGGVLVNPMIIARERDLLFGTNNTEMVTIDNWKDRFYNAETREELEDLKGLFNSRWKIDNFVENVQKLVNGTVESIQSLWEEIKRKDKCVPLWNQAIAHARKYVYNREFQQLFASQSSPTAWGSAQHGSQNPEVKIHQKAGMQYAYYVAYELMKKELDKVGYEAREAVIFSELKDKIGWPKENYFPKGDGSKPELVSWNPVISSPTEKPVDNSDQTDSNSNSDTEITTPDTSEDEKELNKDKLNASVKEDVQAEEEDARERLVSSLMKAQSKDATDEDRIDTISDAIKVFGSQNSQTEQEQVEIVKKALFQNNPELYRQTMVKELEKVMVSQEITEEELNLTSELKTKWTQLKNGEIKEQTQVDEVVKQMNIQIIQQGTTKKITYFKKKAQEVIKSGDKKQIWNLYQEVLLEREKMKVNAYQKNNSEQAHALIAELERGISEQPTTTDPVNSFFLPTLLAVGTIILLVVGLLLIKLWEARKKKNKSSKGSY